jgi:UDP-N-acetylmuramoyl-tripeptide--D-alanyl-D-alanine ligase
LAFTNVESILSQHRTFNIFSKINLKSMKLKSFARRVVLFSLERLMRWRLHKIKPLIIGVTGSVGKTSTKEALYAVASRTKTTFRSQKNYNTEFGLPLSILEQETAYSNPLQWLKVLWNAARDTLNLTTPPYEVLILEMGADRPGDIEHLVKIAQPQIGIITAIKPTHMGEGGFSDLHAIAEEKSKLVQALPENGWAILNAEDPRLMGLENNLRCHTILFGTSSKSDLWAHSIQSGPDGLRFVLSYEEHSQPVHFPHLLGRHHVYVLLPAIAVGFVLNLPLKQIVEALQEFRLPPGRMNWIEGIEGSGIIDSSYNASPESMLAALEVLGEMPGRRIAVLGSMNSLGPQSKKEHLRIGKQVPKHADMLITVGEEGKYYAEAAEAAGMTPHLIACFPTSPEAAQFLKTKLRKNDVVLAKGSQDNIRMERLVKLLMKHPERAKSLLVRQEGHWNPKG